MNLGERNKEKNVDAFLTFFFFYQIEVSIGDKVGGRNAQREVSELSKVKLLVGQKPHG